MNLLFIKCIKLKPGVKMKKNIVAFCLVICAKSFIVGAEIEFEKPRDFFRTMSQHASHETVFLGLKSDFNISNNIDAYIGPDSKISPRVIRLDGWSDDRVVSSGFPIRFNPQRGQLEIAQKTLEESSDAVRMFVYYFCRAYGRLSSKLAVGSTLANGAAAAVASDILHPTIYAYIPLELVDKAAIVHTLYVENNKILESLFNEGAQFHIEIRQAVQKLVSISTATDAIGVSKHTSAHTDISQLTDPSREVLIDDFFSIHPGAAEEIFPKIKMQNLTIRSRIIEILLLTTHGVPSMNNDANGLWKDNFEKILIDSKKNLSMRKTTKLAPYFDIDVPDAVVVADPNVLPSLYSMAIELAKHSDSKHWDSKKLALLDARELVDLFEATPETRRVNALAGSVPRMDVKRIIVDGDEDKVIYTLIFDNLARPYTEEFLLDSKLPRNQRFERISIPWSSPDLRGEGKAIIAIHEDTFVTIIGESGQYRIRAGDVQLGDKIKGYMGLPRPSVSELNSITGELKPTEFTVIRSKRHNLRQEVKIDLLTNQRSPHKLILTPKCHILMSTVAETGIWTSANLIEPGTKTWNHGPCATVNVVIPKTRSLMNNRSSFIEFSLAGSNRQVANNLIVATSKSGPDIAMVEAGSITSSSIDSMGLVHILRPNPPIAIRDVEADKDHNDEIQGTGLIGFFVNETENNLWSNPKLTSHTTWAVTKEFIPQSRVYALGFEDDTVIRLGELSWVLTISDGVLTETCVTPFTLKVGDKIVKGLDNDQKPSWTTLIKMEERPNLTEFVTLETANVGYVKVGPILVGTDENPIDTHTVGLIVKSKLATIQGVGKNKEKSLRNNDVSNILAKRSVIIDPPKLKKQAVASYDPAITGNFSSIPIKIATQGFSTRTMKIEAIHPESKNVLTVEVCPAQRLYIFRPSSKGNIFVSALGLTPEDFIYFAMPDSKKPVKIPLKRVVPQFHFPRSVATLSQRHGGGLIMKSLSSRTTVVFNDGIALGFSNRGFSWEDSNGRSTYVEGDGPGSGAGGKRTSYEYQGEASLHREAGRLSPNYPASQLVDEIALTLDFKKQLEQRSETIKAEFENELTGLQKLPENHRKFWDTHIRQPQLAVLQNWESEQQLSKLNLRARDYLLNLINSPMPFEEEGIAYVDEWMEILHRSRDQFVEKPITVHLLNVLYLECVIGSWLHGMGAIETANILQKEIIELVLVAGCSESFKTVERVRNLDIDLMIELPTFIVNMSPDQLDQRALTGSVQNIVMEWTNRYELVREGTVNLGTVQTALATEVQMESQSDSGDIPPYIIGIPQIGRNGELVPAKWVDQGWIDEHKLQGKRFSNWLVRQACRIAFIRGVPNED